MQSANDAFDQLLAFPETQELLDAARSDNPLIALAVSKRETSWTQFQAWLMDPVRHLGKLPHCFVKSLLVSVVPSVQSLIDSVLDCEELAHLERIGALSRTCNVEVLSAQAEVSESKVRRCDLVLQLLIEETPLTILIENKIGAEERKGQLSDYVGEYIGKRPPNGVLLPMLIELGDDAIGKSSCDWAVCWNRDDVNSWLRCAIRECETRDTSVPIMVCHFLAMFETWNLAAELRSKAWRTIENIENSESPPPEWRLLKDWLTVGNKPFFAEVLNHAAMREVMDRLGLRRISTAGKIRGREPKLQISKPSWSISIPGASAERVNVHFESRNRGDVRLDVEIEPYESGIEKNPDRIRELQPQLELKARLLSSLRTAILQIENQTEIGISTKWLPQPERRGCLTAVKFVGKLGESCSPTEQAEHLVEVISTIHSTVEDHVEAVRMSTGLK